MPDDLDRLVDGLRALPLDLDAEDIADLLWLSATTRVGSSRSPTVRDRPDTGDSNPLDPEEDPDNAAGGVPTEQPAARESGGLYDGTSTGESGRRARQVRIRRPRGLRVPLEMARSLRAFNRRWRTGRGRRLDLDASVAAYARTGRLIPVFRPAPERWFEATVLVDGSPSMDLWRATVTEFTAMLRQLGAFRSVRSLTLDLDGDVPRVRNAAGRVTHPRQLRSATGRRLVLVVSDCLAGAWSGGAVWRMLWEWAGTTPTALINPLPSSLWRRTGLDLPAVRVSSAAVGGANTMLRYQLPWELLDRTGERWLPVPTLAMTAHSMRRWAATLMRADPIGTDAVLVPSSGRVDAHAGDPADVSSVESFRHVASDEAFRLAVLSSPHDPVSLQMLELLRDQFVPAANAGDMAEIIASGVATAERAAGNTVLRVRPALRLEFQQLLSAPEAWRVHEVLTDYVATHAGTRGDLVLAVPDPAGSVVLPAELQPFADASRSTLRLLGIAPSEHVEPDDELVRLVSGAPIEEVLGAFRAAVPGVSAPGNYHADVVRALSRLNVGPGLPKNVEFAERLAARVNQPLAEDLREWTGRRARELGMIRALAWVRADIERTWSRAGADTHSTVSRESEVLRRLVTELQHLPSMTSQLDRNFVVRLLADRLGPPFDESQWGDQNMFDIVDVLARRRDGLPALLDILRELDGATRHVDEVERIIETLAGDERRTALVRALQNVHSMATQQDRDFVMRLLADRLGPLPIEESNPLGERHVSDIVDALARRRDGLHVLLDILRELDAPSGHLDEVARIIEEHEVSLLRSGNEEERLFGLLSGMTVTDLTELYDQVAGMNAPRLTAEATVRDVFLTLETLNADADGLPKPIAFVEQLAVLRPELAAELHQWSDRRASRWNMFSELRVRRQALRAPRSGPAPGDPAYLLLSIRPDDISPEQYELRHWTQINPSEEWRPEPGPDFVGTLDEVRRQVAAVIEDVETKWARYQPDLRIEFLLPKELLNLDVDQWPLETGTDLSPAPIGSVYSLSVRSLERMQATHWHRLWRVRWSKLTDQLQQNGVIEPELVSWPKDSDTAPDVEADIHNRDVVSLVLPDEPDDAALVAGLRSGVPVMVWHRGDYDREQFRIAVNRLLHEGSGSVLGRLRQMRAEARHDPTHVAHNLAVVWDDPQRLVDSQVDLRREPGPSTA